MAQKTKSYLYNLWIRGYKPLEQDFKDFFDSFWHKDEIIPQAKVADLVQALDDRQLRSEKGQGNGYAGLDNTAKVPLSQLPDFAFLIKKADFASLDVTGFERNIYLTENDNKLYYWNGTAYELLSDTSNYQLISEKNTANGYVGLNGSTKIDATYLPSFVDDVIEVADFASLPLTGETGKIYLTLDDNKIYRWSGTVYVEISAGVIPFKIQAQLSPIDVIPADTGFKTSVEATQDQVVESTKAYFLDEFGDGVAIATQSIKADSGIKFTIFRNIITNYIEVESYVISENILNQNGLVISKRNETEMQVNTVSLDPINSGIDSPPAVRTFTFPDQSGRLASINDIPTPEIITYVDDSFTSLAVTGAIGSTGASVTFTTELKNIPYVFVNGLRFKVGVNATPTNNICFLGPDASTVRTSLSAIVSGDLLFWNPLFANSFDLATTDEIILNYTKV